MAFQQRGCCEPVSTTEEDDEERGLPLPGLESLTRSNSQKQLDELVESGLGSINSFAALKLDDAGENIFKSPALKVWMKYVKRVEDNPTAVVLAKLKSHFGRSDDLAIALQKARLVKSTEKTASKLQTAQFEQWHAKGWATTADVVDNVFKFDAAAWRALDVRSAPRQVRKSYSEFLKANHPDFV
ncbi:hypothetical protein PF008_g14048 [Phytophthora fragariae]|uniref:RxLR effector protein n=1 Tax=Phytophthora fragariae TaxID=53985 RepID=A0A6G0RI66_9STRA|nr:hypothetical protein PF008_g14048 [Phytophthora fragariae]